MTIADARKLKPGDQIRLKHLGLVFVVTGREDSGRVIYGLVNGRKDRPATVTNLEVRLEHK